MDGISFHMGLVGELGDGVILQGTVRDSGGRATEMENQLYGRSVRGIWRGLLCCGPCR